MKYYNPKYQDGIEFNYTTNVFNQIKVSLVYQLNEDGDFDIIKEVIDWEDLYLLVDVNPSDFKTEDDLTNYIDDELVDNLDYYINEYVYENFSD